MQGALKVTCLGKTTDYKLSVTFYCLCITENLPVSPALSLLPKQRLERRLRANRVQIRILLVPLHQPLTVRHAIERVKTARFVNGI